jgi:hypothetical protein
VIVLINYKMYLIFLFASLAISIGLQMVLPFPWGLGAALAIFIAFPLMLRKRMLGRMRGSGNFGGGGFFGMNSSTPTVKYVCLTCNNRFKGRECPRCGSTMKRADF